MDLLTSFLSSPHLLQGTDPSWLKRRKSSGVFHAAKAWPVVGQMVKAVGDGPFWGETIIFWTSSKTQEESSWLTSMKTSVSPPVVRSLRDYPLQGTLDIMVQRTGEQGQGNVLFVQNNFYYDAFFLKAIGKSPPRRLLPRFLCIIPVLNGGCPTGWCYTTNGTRFHVCPTL